MPNTHPFMVMFWNGVYATTLAAFTKTQLISWLKQEEQGLSVLDSVIDSKRCGGEYKTIADVINRLVGDDVFSTEKNGQLAFIF